MGVIADGLRATLKQVAESDARQLRALDSYSKRTRHILAEMKTDNLAIAAAPEVDPVQAAVDLLTAQGYTVTPPKG